MLSLPLLFEKSFVNGGQKYAKYFILDKDFIKKLIFGNSEPKFCIEQMLYILDIKNYDKDYNSFREEFIKYSKENGYNISIEFEKFIERLDINSNEIYFERHKKFYTP